MFRVPFLTRFNVMKVILLILTIVYPDSTVQSKVFQAPSSETMTHCQRVVVPGAINNMKQSVPFAKGITGICFEATIDLKLI
tara:strand:- start:575 stop:820 length:246 start_codon:yes stop_codon:yes gene_type:complete